MSNQTIWYFTSLIKRSNQFTRKEKEILMYRLKHKKLEKIGKKYRLTAERIRQIEEKALEKFEKQILQLRLFD